MFAERKAEDILERAFPKVVSEMQESIRQDLQCRIYLQVSPRLYAEAEKMRKGMRL